MLKYKLFYFIITVSICFLALNQAKSYGSDGHIIYSLDEILEKVEDANSHLKTMDADIKYSRVISLLDSEEVSLGYLQYK